MYKQIIIVRKDLNMSPGKLAAQVSHASMAFLSWMIRNNAHPEYKQLRHPTETVNSAGEIVPQIYRHAEINAICKEAFNEGKTWFRCKFEIGEDGKEHAVRVLIPEYDGYDVHFSLDKGLYEEWINGAFTKTILQAKNKNQLLKAKTLAEELGMKEGKEFFLIKDNCYTELEPEEFDEDGVGRTLTCIGFRPMDAEIIDKIGKKFHLYVE